MYYIEERTEYKYRERQWETYTTTTKNNYDRYEGSNTTYGNWSEWQNSYISSSDTLQVETRTQSSPTEYFYAHYCTGNLSDASIRYRTNDYKFCDQCSYHELGWRSEPLPSAPDGVGYLLYKDNGNKYRCSNTCYRYSIPFKNCHNNIYVRQMGFVEQLVQLGNLSSYLALYRI